MPKTTQTTTYRRGPKGEMIPDTQGKDFDSDSAIAAEEKNKKAFAAMASGAKPKVSEDEPADKTSIQYMAWKRKQKGKTAQDGAVALASR